MFEELSGKKLLVIGSEETEVNIVNAAHSMGIYVIAVDGKKKSEYTFAKSTADEAWDIDYNNIEEIGNKCIECGVEGVFAGYSESRVMAACKIASYIGTPFYATEEQILLTRNKRLFKDECIKYGISVPRDYYVDNSVQISNNDIEFPVIVKPADYAGRKGITVCENADQLKKAVDNALCFSSCRMVIIEEYLKGVEFSAIYTICNGDISLSCFNEKYLNEGKNHRSLLCDLSVTAPWRIEGFAKVDRGIKQFLKGIGAKNAVAFFQGIYHNNEFYIFEMGYRLNGGNDCVAIEKENGINYMKMLISYSLTGNMGCDLKRDNPYYKKIYSNLLFYSKEGEISSIGYYGKSNYHGIDEIHISLCPGSQVVDNDTTAQRAFSFRISADDMSELATIIEYIKDNIVLADKDGKSMLLYPFDINRLKG